MFTCSSCGRELPGEDRVRREQLCPSCGAYLHCCMNCRFYTGNQSSRRCNEPQAEEVRDPRGANFCDFFSPTEKGTHPSPRDVPAQDQPRARFEALFRKGTGREEKETP